MFYGLRVKAWFTVVFLMVVWGSGMAVGLEGQPQAGKHRFVLVGASIGQEWKLAEFPARAGRNDVEFESIAVWQFDKSDAVEELLMRPKRKFRLTRTYFTGLFDPNPLPADVVILKECSSYFPGETEQYKSMMMNWIGKVRAAGKRAAVTTVVPITRARSATSRGKLEAIRDYNDWIRAYAKNNKVPVLDLEQALSDGTPERYLRDELTSGDGSHLNAKAYSILDQLLKTKLCELAPETKCTSTP